MYIHVMCQTKIALKIYDDVITVISGTPVQGNPFNYGALALIITMYLKIKSLNEVLPHENVCANML